MASEIEPITPSRSTRSRTTKAGKGTTPRKKLVDDEDFVKENSAVEEDSQKSGAKSNKRDLHEAEIHYEFGGPFGALAVMLGLPFVIYALFFLCNDKVCMTNPLDFDWQLFLAQLNLDNLFTKEGTYMYLGWMAFSVLLERILPGEYVEGTVLPNTTGKRLGYTMSGHLQFWVCLLAVTHAIPLVTTFTESTDADSWLHNVYQIQGFVPLRLELIYDHYVPLISISIVFTTAMSLYLYLSSFFGNPILAKGGNTGSALYDFFIGRELNPRIGSLDLKEFCELRPGLIGWFVINLGESIL